MERKVNLTTSLIAEISDEVNEEAKTYIHEEIKSFNDAVSEHHRLARVTGTHPLNIIVRDQYENIIGGLIAETYWGWLDIDDFWLEKNQRGRGLGSLLLNMAEDEAKTRDCRRAQLKTFSFQARTFYEKCGYRVTGELPDYPPGQSLYWMSKKLV